MATLQAAGLDATEVSLLQSLLGKGEPQKVMALCIVEGV